MKGQTLGAFIKLVIFAVVTILATADTRVRADGSLPSHRRVR